MPFDEALLRPYDDDANVALHAAAGESGVAARDPKLMRHAQISPASAETWRRHVPQRPLTSRSAAVARALGYTLAGADDAAPAPLRDP